MTIITSRLVTHANHELNLIGYGPLPIDMEARSVDINDLMRKNIIDLVTMFAGQQHSGASSDYLVQTLNELLQFKTLTPISRKASEWAYIPEAIAGDKITWQNRRNSAALSSDGGKTYYLVNDDHRPLYEVYRKLPKAMRLLVWNRFRFLILTMYRSVK
jgi:hypothetical protein